MSTFIAAAVGGTIAAAGAIGGATISANAAQNAANTEAGAANSANQLQYSEFQQQQANEAPWLSAGTSALGQMRSMASTTPTFTQADFLANEDPAYGFDLSQGQQAIERSAAAQGGLQSGGTLKSLTNYAQGMASNEYSNAYNRFMTNQNTQFSRLGTLAGYGQTATAGVNQAGTNMANNVGNTTTSLGSAQGAAQIAQGNVWGNALSSTGNNMGGNLMQAGMLNSILQNGGGNTGGLGGNVSTPGIFGTTGTATSSYPAYQPMTANSSVVQMVADQ